MQSQASETLLSVDVSSKNVKPLSVPVNQQVISWTMSLNLQLFLLLLITTLRYGFLGFTLSMFLNILIIIFLYSSLHNRRFMSQARRTRHFEQSAKRARSAKRVRRAKRVRSARRVRSAKRAECARRGAEENKASVTSPFFWLLIRPPTPTSID